MEISFNTKASTWTGGAGFSGGGAGGFNRENNGGWGGTDGGNGDDSDIHDGGEGMNVSVAVFDAAFAQFNLRAGSGGRYDDTYGGGGGGIEVEGFSASRSNGGGFGAGGAYSRGTSGLVLVEVLSNVRLDDVDVINDEDICSSPPTTKPPIEETTTPNKATSALSATAHIMAALSVMIYFSS